METEFPSVADATQRSTLLLKRRKWSLATDLCGANGAPQVACIELAANIQAPEELPVQLAQFGLDSEAKAKVATVIERRAIDDGGLRSARRLRRSVS